jgi:hypothetical protein
MKIWGVSFGLLVAALLGMAYGRKDPNEPSALYLTWLRDPTTTMTVQWQDGQKNALVSYQKEGDAYWQVAEGTSYLLNKGQLLTSDLYVHTVELVQLLPDTNYKFHLGKESASSRFRTMPQKTDRPVHFVVGGDLYQDDFFRFKKMNGKVAKMDPDFIVLGGDIAYTRGHRAVLKGRYFEIQRWQTFFKAWKEQLVTSDGRLIPFVIAVGNHDLPSKRVDPKKEPVLFYELFALPEQGTPFRALDFGDYLSFFLLDTGHTVPIIGKQTEWLQKALAERKGTKAHQMAVYHVAAYPSFYAYRKGTPEKIRQNWIPLFDQYQVKTVFEHHDHAYKRTFALKNDKVDPTGTLYLGDGAWGVSPRVPSEANEVWYLAKTASKNYVFLVSLQAEKGVVQAIDIDGNIFDEVAIGK